jgi:O-antigen/teichoic acid export membrane protein
MKRRSAMCRAACQRVAERAQLAKTAYPACICTPQDILYGCCEFKCAQFRASMTAGNSDTGHLPRLIKEQLGQLLTVAVGFFDRIVLTAILFRYWGTEPFEQWSTILAFAGFGSLFEFGFNLYYYNRIAYETERGEKEAAVATLFEANTVFIFCSVIGTVAMAALVATPRIGGILSTDTLFWPAVFQTSAATIRLSIIGANSLYWANRSYARLAMIISLSEFLRIAVTALAVISGGDIFTVSLISLLVQLAMPVAFIAFDSTQRFHPHKIGFSVPSGRRMLESFKKSSAYFGQLLPMTVLTAGPVLLLQKLPVASGAIASFILVRTLTNIARTPMQSLGVVIGQECSRLIAREDFAAAFRSLQNGSRLFAALGGISCGYVVVFGKEIIEIWTGKSPQIDNMLLIYAMLPMGLVTITLLTSNIFMTSNSAFIAMLTRLSQLLFTMIIYYFLIIDNDVTRIILSLSLGEIFGLIAPSFIATRNLFKIGNMIFFAKNLLFNIFCALSGILIALFSVYLSKQFSARIFIPELIICTLLSTLFLYVFAADTHLRRDILMLLRTKMALKR